MTFLFLQFPFLWILAILCMVLSGVCVRKKSFLLFLTASFCSILLILLALGCLIPYQEIILLLLPSLLSAFLLKRKEGNA